MAQSKLALASLSVMVAAIAIAAHPSIAQRAAPVGEPEIRLSATVDYDGFSDLVTEVARYREARLISLDTFNKMAAEPDTIILDTRSTEAFEAGHIAGAIHLGFSDFTTDKLAEIIPSPETRILIYCNNNFDDNVAPVPTKRAPLALNLPTFVNLYGYGYFNVYELSDLVSMDQVGVNWVKGTGSPSG